MRPDVVQVGLDHRGTPHEALAALHRLRSLRSQPSTPPAGVGVVELATCHRAELYLEGVHPDQARGLFAAWMIGRAAPCQVDPLLPALSVRRGADAARHLLRVASGLESAVLGEDQILRQVRQAYSAACARRSAGPLLHRLFHAAFRAGKRVRSETELGCGGRSLAGAAVATLARLLGGLEGRSALVLGVGEMGALAARRLRARGIGHLMLSNRTWSGARALAAELDAEALPWEWRSAALCRVDGVICATGAALPVLEARWLRDASLGRRLVAIDLAMPANVEKAPDPPPTLELLDMEQLSLLLEEQAGRRRLAVCRADAIVDDLAHDWLAWVRSRPAGMESERRKDLSAS